MENKQSGSTGINNKAQFLLDKALKQKAVKRTEPVAVKSCVEEYGNHEWMTHEETLVEFCKHCKMRKDVWEGEKRDNTSEKTREYNIPEAMKEKMWKKGESGNPAGRPKGSRNLTTIVMEALKAKKLKVKAEDGSITIMSGEEAFAEAILENAIKKKDRESLRMIWEMSDGKPKQQHKLEINGPKGYAVNPERERLIQKQFGMYEGEIDIVETPKIEAVEAVVIETDTNTTQEAKQEPEPKKEANNTQIKTQNNENVGIQEKKPSEPSGVREA